MNSLKAILSRCYDQELNHKNYICAYHGCSAATADLQDFYNALYQKNILKKEPVTFTDEDKEQFIFLRNPTKRITT